MAKKQTLADFAFAKDPDLPEYEEFEIDDVTFGLKRPTLRESAEVERAVAVNEGGKVQMDISALHAEVATRFIVDPETGDNVFETAHRGMILDSRKGERLYRIVEAATTKYLRDESADKDKAGKSSEGDQTSSSS